MNIEIKTVLLCGIIIVSFAEPNLQNNKRVTFRMNIVLITPPEQAMLVEAGDRPPMGALYLAGALRRAGHRPTICDLNHDSYYTLKQKLNFIQPEFIAITTTTPYLAWCKNYASHLRHNYPNAKLIAGGPHASADPDSLIEQFDYIVKGEGERAIIDIVEGKLKHGIIMYPLIKDIDTLPMPAWDLVPVERYGIIQEGIRTGVILSSRSCPFRCFFCGKTIMGEGYRMHSVDRIMKEMKILHDNYGFRSFYFIDDCFTINKTRVLEFAKRMQEEKLGSFRLTSRTDTIDEEMMIALKDAGIRSISFGLEHMDNNVLKNIQKNNTRENNIKAVRLAKQYDIGIRGSFVLNLPGATKETMYDCLHFAIEENLDFADFYTLVAYPGTPVWKNPDKFGVKLISKDYNIYQTSGKTNVKIKGFSNIEIERIAKDINTKWRKFKGTNTPWELKRNE